MSLSRPLLFAILLTGCGRGVADLNTFECTDCEVCEVDADCVISHNPCLESATCAHVDDMVAVPLLGCNPSQEYQTPLDSDCMCAASRCEAVSPE